MELQFLLFAHCPTVLLYPNFGKISLTLSCEVSMELAFKDFLFLALAAILFIKAERFKLSW